MRIAILGPLTVTDDEGTEIVVRQRKQRHVITTLALHSGYPVSTESLADLVWGTGPPTRVSGCVVTQIWAIRRERSFAERLTHLDSGYRLELDPSELDAEQFRRHAECGMKALERADPVTAAACLDEALRLWRDPPLADVPETPTMLGLTECLLGERRSVQDAAADSRLALGQHRQLLGELRRRVVEQPLHELAWAHLMTALYRCGMRADALASYLRARQALRDECGIEPGPELQRLHLRILRDDPALLLAGPV